MKSPQEILLEVKTVQLQQAQAEKQWSDIIRNCRTPIWPGAVGLVTWSFLMAVIFFSSSQDSSFKTSNSLSYIFLFSGLTQIFVVFRKREQGLLAAIQREAPQLYQKLKRESAA